MPLPLLVCGLARLSGPYGRLRLLGQILRGVGPLARNLLHWTEREHALINLHLVQRIRTCNKNSASCGTWGRTAARWTYGLALATVPGGAKPRLPAPAGGGTTMISRM